MAAEKGNTEVCEILLAAGADVNKEDKVSGEHMSLTTIICIIALHIM